MSAEEKTGSGHANLRRTPSQSNCHKTLKAKQISKCSFITNFKVTLRCSPHPNFAQPISKPIESSWREEPSTSEQSDLIEGVGEHAAVDVQELAARSCRKERAKSLSLTKTWLPSASLCTSIAFDLGDVDTGNCGYVDV